jgi:hypothetical protein
LKVVEHLKLFRRYHLVNQGRWMQCKCQVVEISPKRCRRIKLRPRFSSAYHCYWIMTGSLLVLTGESTAPVELPSIHIYPDSILLTFGSDKQLSPRLNIDQLLLQIPKRWHKPTMHPQSPTPGSTISKSARHSLSRMRSSSANIGTRQTSAINPNLFLWYQARTALSPNQTHL